MKYHTNPFQTMPIRTISCLSNYTAPWCTISHYNRLHGITFCYIPYVSISIHTYHYMPSTLHHLHIYTHVAQYMQIHIYIHIHTHVSWYTVYIRYLYHSISISFYIYLKQARVNSFLTPVSSQSHIYLPIYLPAYLSTYLSKLSIYFAIDHYRSDWNIIYCNRLQCPNFGSAMPGRPSRTSKPSLSTEVKAHPSSLCLWCPCPDLWDLWDLWDLCPAMVLEVI